VPLEVCVRRVCNLAQRLSSRDDSATKKALAERLREISAGDPGN
jgi:hypothetical protein